MPPPCQLRCGDARVAWQGPTRSGQPLRLLTPGLVDVRLPVDVTAWSPSAIRLSLTADAPHVGSRWRCSSELAVEVVGGADQCEVREGLREVAELFACRADLLGVEPDVVRVAEHLLEGQPRLVEPPRARECLDPPERAHREGRLSAG